MQDPIRPQLTAPQSTAPRPTASRATLLELSAGVALAYVSHNKLAGGDLPDLISAIFETLSAAAQPAAAAAAAAEADRTEPAVPVRKSVTQEYLICLEDGQRFKSLRRHLSLKYNMSPEAYRAKWGLPIDYPMVAPAYAAERSAIARRRGLGRSAEGDNAGALAAAGAAAAAELAPPGAAPQADVAAGGGDVTLSDAADAADAVSA